MKQAFAGQTSITNVDIARRDGKTLEENADPWQNTFQADFDLQSPETGNKPVQVRSDEIFVAQAANSCYTQGRMTLSGDDGSSMVIDANNGKDESFNLSITNAEITTTMEIQWNEVNSFQPYRVTDRDESPMNSVASCDFVEELR